MGFLLNYVEAAEFIELVFGMAAVVTGIRRSLLCPTKNKDMFSVNLPKTHNLYQHENMPLYFGL